MEIALSILTWTVTIRKSFGHGASFPNQARHLEIVVLIRIVNECSPFDRSLVVLTIDAFTVRATKNPLLETFTIFLQASRLLARTSFCVLFFSLFILICSCTLPLSLTLHSAYVCLCALLLSNHCIYLRSKSVRCLFKSLLHGLLS